jgi:anti-anti-sigma regulatory factor
LYFGEKEMIVTLVKEHDDGSADVCLTDVSPELMQLIVQTGFLKLMHDALDKEEADNKLPALLKKAK